MSLDHRKSEPRVHIVNHCVFMMIPFKTDNSLEVQWLGLCAFTADGPGSILCWRTKIPKPQDSAYVSSVLSLSRVQLFATPWTAAHQASLSITSSQSLFKLMSIESVMLSNHLILCRPLLLLPSVFPSIRVFSNESVLCLRWPKYWSFNINPSNEYSGLISFRIDWLDLLAVQGTLKSLLQFHSSKASILWHSALCIVQLTSIHEYWKNHSFD